MLFYVPKWQFYTELLLFLCILLTALCFLLFTGSDPVQIVVGLFGLLAIFSIRLYVAHKQLQRPLLQLSDSGMTIDDVSRSIQRIAWDRVIGISRYPLLGHRLQLTYGEAVWLPLGRLRREDRKLVLEEIGRRL